jgi:hypothetical protein
VRATKRQDAVVEAASKKLLVHDPIRKKRKRERTERKRRRPHAPSSLFPHEPREARGCLPLDRAVRRPCLGSRAGLSSLLAARNWNERSLTRMRCDRTCRLPRTRDGFVRCLPCMEIRDFRDRPAATRDVSQVMSAVTHEPCAR